MFKNAFKNFINNIVYIFVPMGIVYFFLLIAIFWFVNAVMGCTVEMISSLSELIRVSSEQSSTDVTAFLSYAFEQIDWNGNFFATLSEIADEKWLSNTVTGFFETLNASTEGFDESIAAILNDFSGTLRAYLSLAVSVCSLGVTLANFTTGWLLRRSVAKRTIKKTIVAHTVVPLVQSAVIVASMLLLYFIRFYGLLVFAAMLIISCAFSLTSSWIIHGKGKIKLRRVLTPKNIIKHIAILGLTFLVDALLALLLYFINPLLALLLMIPVVIYTLAVVNVNTDSYIVYLVKEEAERVPAPEEPADKASKEAAEEAALSEIAAGAADEATKEN